MRDLALLTILPYLVYSAFKKPFIGIGLWMWTSCFKIDQLVYGIAASIPYTQVFAGIAILSVFNEKNKPPFKLDATSFFIILLLFWTLLSSIFSMGHAETVWTQWTNLFKIVLFYLVAINIIKEKLHFDFLAWMAVISVGAMGSEEGAKYIVSAGSHKIYSVRGILGDNNYVGLMLDMTLPFVFYLLAQNYAKWINSGLWLVIILMIAGILATASRGAFIGLTVIIFYFIWSSKNKLFWLFFIGFIVFSANNFIPEEWFNRMNTIESADTDSSFLGRVINWKISTIIAMDNPFFGAGFKAVENVFIRSLYLNDVYKLDFIATPPAESATVYSAHSIYFQVLGDHGFMGLLIYLLMLIVTLLKLSSMVTRAYKYKLESWVIYLAKILRLSLFVFCLSGALLSVAYIDLLYAIFALTYSLDFRIIRPAMETKK